ncbi:MAG: glycosyltransferase [Thermogutta sp.]
MSASTDGFWLILTGLWATAALFQAALLLLQAYEHRRFAASRLQDIPRLDSSRPTLLIVPCRGAEPGLAENLERFFRQDHPNYKIRFVVERPEDPAYQIIRGLIAAHSARKAEVLFAGEAAGEAQKVHNLRLATADIPDDIEVLAFADSDAAPPGHWLRALTSRLEDRDTAAVTGYRWFIAPATRLADAVVYSINAGYAMLLGSRAPNLVWGGSWAITRATFDRLAIRDAWSGTICDDLRAADVLRRAGLRVQFEPACMIPTRNHWNWSDTLAFIERQFSLARYVIFRWWLSAVLLQTFAQVSFWGLLLCAWAGPSMPVRVAAGTAAGLLYVVYALRGVCRAWATRTYCPDAFPRMRWIFLIDILAAPCLALLGWAALIRGGWRRDIRWRGIVYRRERNGTWRIVNRRSPESPGGPAAIPATPPPSVPEAA